MLAKPISLVNGAFFASTWILRVCVLLLGLLYAVADGQAPNPYGWSKFHGNSRNSGLTLGGNVLPTPLWKTQFAGNVLPSSPAVGPDGTVFIGVGSNVQAYSGVTGAPGWTYTTAGSVLSTPAVSDGNTVYVGSVNTNSGSGNILYALNGLSGSVKWTYSASGPLYASPAIANDGTVYIASWDGYVTALDGSTGTKKWSVSPAGNGTDAFKSSPAIGTDGTIYIGSFNGNLYALSPGGAVSWSYTTNGHIVSSPAFCTYGVQPMAGITGTIVVGCDDNSLYAVRSDGSLMWTARMGNPVSSSPAIGPDFSVVVADEDHHIYSFDITSGTMKWFFTTGAPVESSVAIGADGTVYVGPDDGNVYAINGTTGSQIFAYGVPGANSSPAINANGTLYVGTGTGIIAFQSVYVDQFGITPTDVLSGKIAVATVDLNQAAPAGGAFVQVHFDSKFLSAPNYVIVPAGQKTVSFVVQTLGVNSTTTFSMSVNPGINQTAQITVEGPKVISVSVSPSVVPELSPSSVTVVLNGPIGPADTLLALSSNNSAAQVPPNKVDPHPPTLGGNSSGGAYPITTSTVDKLVIALISSSFGGGSGSATLTINPANLVSVTLNPTSVAGGLASVATLTLDNLAGPSGAVVAISSSTPSAQVPSTVTVPKDATSVTFNITTSPVPTTTVANIVATLLGVPRSANLTITPIQLSSITVNPPIILGGKSSSGTVTLNGPAGANGIQVFLKTSNSIASVPTSVTVPKGQATAIFNIPTNTTDIVQKAVITATQGQINVTATLTVDPPTPATVSLSPSTVIGGTTSSGTVLLDGVANSGGALIALTSSDPAASVPASLTIPEGAISGSFLVNTIGVNAATSATITASGSGIAASAVLSISAAAVSALSFTPSTVIGGNTSSGIVTLTGPASPAGTVVTLTLTTGTIQIPATLTVAPGQRTGSFPAITLGVDSLTSATVVASLNGTATGKLFIAPAGIAAVVLNPSTVAGGTQPTGIAQLNGAAGPSGITVSLSSDNKNAAVPASVKILAGITSGSFPISVKQVTKPASADISGSYAGVTQTAILHMVPLALATLTISPAEINGGASATGTLTLDGNALKGGTSVRVSSSSAAAIVPGSVVIPAGSSTTTFQVKTHGVAVKTVAALTATMGGVSSKASLTIDPPILQLISLAPNSVTGGFTSTATVVLSGAAPPSGIKIALSSNLGAAKVPATVTVPSGKTTATFALKTTPVTVDSQATISGLLNGVTVTASLDIKPTVLVSLTIKPSSVAGGRTSVGTVTVSGPAPTGGFTVAISTQSSVASAPTKVLIPVGKTSVIFTIKTTKVNQSTSATFTATFGSGSSNAVLTIT